MQLKNKILTLFLLCSSLLNGQSESQNFRIIIADWEIIGDGLEESYGAIISNSIRTYMVKANCSPRFEILEREDMATLFKDKSNAEKVPEIYDKNTAVELGKVLQGNYVVFGSMTKSELFDNPRLSIRLVEVQTGKIVVGDEVEYLGKQKYDETIMAIVLSLTKSISGKTKISFCDDFLKKKTLTPYNYKHSNDIEKILKTYKSKLDVYLVNEDCDETKLNDARNHPCVNIQDLPIGFVLLEDKVSIFFNEKGFFVKEIAQHEVEKTILKPLSTNYFCCKYAYSNRNTVTGILQWHTNISVYFTENKGDGSHSSPSYASKTELNNEIKYICLYNGHSDDFNTSDGFLFIDASINTSLLIILKSLFLQISKLPISFD
jgi:hypothetical protein